MNKPIRHLSGAGGGPSSPTIQEVTLITEDVVELNLGICEGPIAGLLRGARSFYLDDTPLVSATGENNFDPFELHFFHGSDTPTSVRNVLGGLSNNTAVGVSLAEATPVVRLTSSASQGAVDILELRFLINRLLKTNSGGDQLYNTLEMNVHFREVGTQEWQEFFPGNGTVKVEGRIEGAVKEFRRVVPRISGEWEIKVEKLNPDNDSFLFAEVTWESIQEVTNEVQSYENLAVIRGLSAASDQFSSFPQFSGVYGGKIVKIPTNYDPVTRHCDGVWDGTFKDGYTDNPAWCLYDMLTNPVYGAKAYYPGLQVDRFSFYEAALWCDELVARGDGTTYQPRYTYNDLILEPRQGREQLQYMAGFFGGVLTQDFGGTVVLKIDKPGVIKQIFGPESVSVEGFQYQYTSVESRPNSMKVTFVNPDLGWEEDLREVEIPTFVGANGRITEDFVAVGCIDPFEAERRAMLRLLQANTETCSVSFKIARQALALDVLDLIGIADPDQRWGLSGRIQSVDGATILLRDPLLVPVDTNLDMSVQTPTGVATLTVRSTIANTKSLTVVAGTVPTNLPDRAQFSITDNGSDLGLVKPFRLLSVTEDDTDPNFFIIHAIEVNTNKWSDADNVTYTGEVNYTGGKILKFDGIRASSGTEHLLKHSDGTIESRIFVGWNPTDLLGIKLIYRRKGQDTRSVVEAAGNSGVYVPGVQDGKDYELRLVGRTPRGKVVRSEWFQHTATGKTAPPATPTNLVGEGSFQSVSFSWLRNFEPDFSHFEVYEGEATPDAETTGQKTTETNQITFVNVGPTDFKRIFVRAVDTTGNASEWAGPVVASGIPLEDTQTGETVPIDLVLDRLAELDLDGRISAVLEDARLNGEIEEQRTELSAQIGEVSANLTQNYVTAASQTAALAQLETSLTAQTNTAIATATQNLVTYAAQDYAFSIFETDLLSQVDDNIATATSTLVTQSDMNSAIAASLVDLETTVGQHTTSISTVTASVDGVLGTYGVKVNNNGVVSGFGLVSELIDGTVTSTFTVQANKFVIASFDGSAAVSPFTVKNGVTYIENGVIQDAAIGSAKIEDLAVESIKIAGEAVETPKIANNAATAIRKATGGGGNKQIAITNNTGVTINLIVLAFFRTQDTATAPSAGCRIYAATSSGGTDGLLATLTETGPDTSPSQNTVVATGTVAGSTNISNGSTKYIRAVGFGDSKSQVDLLVFQRQK